MTTKKTKKSIAAVRPQMGTFTLAAMPGVEFRFRKITLEDNSWCMETFGKEIGELFVPGNELKALDLCRVWFHFLEPDDKACFKAVVEKVADDDTGEEREVMITRPMVFMRKIAHGVVELALIAEAFAKTLAASAPDRQLPEDLKKKMAAAAKQIQESSQPAPSGA